MKLAQILATSPLPSGSNIRLASPTASPIAVGLQGLAEASQSIAGTAERVGELQARAEKGARRAEDAKQKHQDALDALSAVNTAGDALDQTETDLQMGRRDDTTGEVLEPPATHDLYVPRWEQQWEAIQDRALEQARTPEARMVVEKSMARLYGTRLAQARKYSNALFVDQFGAGFEQNVEGLERKIARATDPAQVQELEGLLGRAFDMATGVIPLKQLQARARVAEERIDTARARRLGETDPEAAIEALEGGQYRLAPVTADAEAERIRGRWNRRVHQDDANQRRFETEMDRWWKEQQQLTVSDAVLKAHRGAYTLEQLEDDARDWRLHREDIAAIRAAIVRPEKSGKEQSDPATLDRVIADTHSQFPKMTEARLLDLRTQGLLSVGDWKSALDRLRETREGLQREARAERERGEGRVRSDAERKESQARSIAKDRHGQAEQEGLAELGIPTLYDKLDDKKTKAKAGFLVDMRTQSNAYDGKLDPLEAKRLAVERWRTILDTSARLTEEDIRKVLLFPTPAALEAARPTLSRATYQRQQDLFRQLKEQLDTRRQMLEEQAAKPGGTKPGGSMGRK